MSRFTLPSLLGMTFILLVTVANAHHASVPQPTWWDSLPDAIKIGHQIQGPSAQFIPR
jgi:hypothetical protein